MNGSMHMKLGHQKVSLEGQTSNNIENSIARWVGFGENITPGFSEEHFNLDSSDNITHKRKRNEKAQLSTEIRRTSESNLEVSVSSSRIDGEKIGL